MSAMAFQITNLAIVYSIVYSGTDQRIHPSSVSLAFVWGIQRWPVIFPTQKASNAENVSIWWRHHVNWLQLWYFNGNRYASCRWSGPIPNLLTQIRHAYIFMWRTFPYTLQWRHDKVDGVSNHQPHDCLLNGLFRRRSKKTSELRVTGLCAGNSPVTGEFPAKMASNAENVSIWWHHHAIACNIPDFATMLWPGTTPC